MPLREDPEVTLGALRWTIDQVYRPGDVMHLVHVIKCLVHKLEVFHGDCPELFLAMHFCSRWEVLPEKINSCSMQQGVRSTGVNVCAGMPGTTFSFDDPGEAHHESEDVARAKAFLQRRYASPSRAHLACRCTCHHCHSALLIWCHAANA